eukprot:406119-Heterocapsa_arctica.AAC.1
MEQLRTGAEKPYFDPVLRGEDGEIRNASGLEAATCAVLGGPSALRRCLRALSPAPGVRGVRGARVFCIARADALSAGPRACALLEGDPCLPA